MNETSDLYLIHHGIKGQKWGVRRYQNSDGSLTPAGKVRYGKNVGSISNSSLIFDMDDPHTRKVVNTGRAIVGGIAVGGVVLVASGATSTEDSKYYDSSTGLLKSKKQHSAIADTLGVNMGRVFAGWPGWGNNCALCSAAYDIRRRGYNVRAGQSFNGESIGVYRNWYPGCKYEYVPQKISSNRLNLLNPVTRIKDIRGCLGDATKAMEAHGPGARGVMLVQWASGGGHAIAWENDAKGRATFVESQIGVRFRNPVAKAAMFSNLNPYDASTSVVRLDNVKPDYDLMKKEKVVVNNPTVHKPTRIIKHSDIEVGNLQDALDIIAQWYPDLEPTDIYQQFDHYYIIELGPKGYDKKTNGPLLDALYFVDVNDGNCGAWIPIEHTDYVVENITPLNENGDKVTWESILHGQNDILMHHGIKGMKWGVRRYQNADGTLNAAGKRRYAIQDARKYYKINRLQRVRERSKDENLNERLDKRIRRTQTRSDRKRADLSQRDINVGRQIVARNRRNWAAFNTAAKAGLTAAGAYALYQNPKTRALVPLAVAGGAAATMGSAKKLPYYTMEARRYKQVNPKGSTSKGLTKNQKALRKFGKAAAGAALAGATGYALYKTGAGGKLIDAGKNAVTSRTNTDRIQNGSGVASKVYSKAKTTAKNTGERVRTAAKEKVKSSIRNRVTQDVDYNDPRTWIKGVNNAREMVGKVKRYAQTAKAVKNKDYSTAAMNVAPDVAESTNKLVDEGKKKVKRIKTKFTRK